MKIIDITPFFHKKSGGIRQYLLEKAKFLSAYPEIKHILIVPGRKKTLSHLYNSKVYEVSSVPIPGVGGYRYFRNLAEIKEILEMECPHIVEFGGIYHLIDRFKEGKFYKVCFYHSDVELYFSLFHLPPLFRDWLWKNFLVKKFKRMDLIFSPSRPQRDKLIKHGLEKVITLNLGVDINIFNPTKRDDSFAERYNLNGKVVKLLYVGRLSPEKNVSFLLKIMERLDAKSYQLFVVGDGPERAKVEKIGKRLGNVIYLGYIDNREELSTLYASCDIFISASNSETFGLAFVESQACGCVLVAQDMGLETQPFKEFLVKGSSKKESLLEDYHRAINRAASLLSTNTSLRYQISSFIHKAFSWEETFNQLLKHYEALLKS
ncbi:MAG: glycosyltransferase [Caldimicrobium sp.]|nr:glycosyltransferase [Caldimicrobium sp.]MCX7874072.1 glycosyltransferase [Caldimicrobium sp.]MDW8094360.1 glycosyltransferase [Caldimicrobium sp.]